MTDDKLNRANELARAMKDMLQIEKNCTYPWVVIAHSSGKDEVITNDTKIREGLYELASKRYQELKEEHDNL